jgi:hypothetical protein
LLCQTQEFGGFAPAQKLFFDAHVVPWWLKFGEERRRAAPYWFATTSAVRPGVELQQLQLCAPCWFAPVPSCRPAMSAVLPSRRLDEGLHQVSSPPVGLWPELQCRQPPLFFEVVQAPPRNAQQRTNLVPP